MTSGLSLAHKCQILFGLAIVLLLMAALSVPWFRVASLARQTQEETCELIADIWLEWALRDASDQDIEERALSDAVAGMVERLEGPESGRDTTSEGSEDTESSDPAPRVSPRPTLQFISLAHLNREIEGDPFLNSARRQFENQPSQTARSTMIRREDGGHVFRYARAVHWSTLLGHAVAEGESDQLVGLLLVEQNADRAAGILLVDRMYIIATGIAAGILASLAFYLITTRLILSPVRVLREVTERVQSGDMNIRSDIRTADEFEQLSDTFNGMLVALKEQQDSLWSANQSLDHRLAELAQTNVDLYENARLKGEFLASVSHELRTPLNSIIGFAEILQDIASRELPAAARSVEQAKRARYIDNIVASGRSLLDMINELLDMAKIEAGKVELRIEPTSVSVLCEALIGLIRPQARKKNIDLQLRVAPELPIIETDPTRLRQIIFNFLSNAVKFTPEDGRVEVWAELVQQPTTHDPQERSHVRIGVTDTGPGIPEDQQSVIFDKFHQLDAGHTREYTGTGLGLAICKELAALLHGDIEVISRVGQGSTFSLTLPHLFTPDEAAERVTRTRPIEPSGPLRRGGVADPHRS
jgi:two-component system sensor histidine kinase BarA